MGEQIDIALPDIGDYKDVPIVEIYVKVGDVVAVDSPLLTVESDKATMEVPSPSAGVVKELKVGVGSRVSQGSLLMMLSGEGGSGAVSLAKTQAPAPTPKVEVSPPPPAELATSSPPRRELSSRESATVALASAHASPSVRALARALGVELANVRPTGPKGRILREDVSAYLKQSVGSPSAAPSVAGAGLPEWPKVDFAKYGAIERTALSRIQKISGANLTRNWVTIPHVTNFDKADVTEAEAFRQQVNREAGSHGIKITMVSFLIKSAALALKTFPRFCASLDGDDLVLKKYVHIGFAVDTPKGLMVPVIRDCDRKGLLEIASEMRTLADKAVVGNLGAADMQGRCFSVSSLGGIGGAGFTPIINAPEVAILGAGRSATEAVWNGEAFRPRMVLPISLSWDHRVVDGVAAAKFLGQVAATLADLRRAVL